MDNPLHTFYVLFTIEILDYAEEAPKNYPDLQGKDQILAQFKKELRENLPLDNWDVLYSQMTETDLNVMVQIQVPITWTVEKLQEEIQTRCFDYGGVTGNFQIQTELQTEPAAVLPKAGNMKEKIKQLKADKVILEAAQEIADRRGFVPGLCEYVIKEIVEEIDGLENQNADPWKGAKELLDHWEVKTGFREDCFKVSQYVRHLQIIQQKFYPIK